MTPASPLLDNVTERSAYERNGQWVSRADFYAIACNPQRSVAVEACAGAGKTWMLVSRIVRALVDDCPAQDILAITFTKKAAGEMRQRLQHWLQEFATASDAQLHEELLIRGVPPQRCEACVPRLRGLHLALLRGGRPVQIRTFHSWFASLVRSAPLGVLQALGLPANYELLENDSRALALVWRRFQSRVAADADQRQDYIDAVAAHGRHQTLKGLEAALSKRVEFALADAQGVVDTSVQTFAEQYPAMAELDEPNAYWDAPACQSLLWEAARLLGASTLVTCLQAARTLEGGLTQRDPAAIRDALLTKTGTARKLSEKLTGIETVRRAQTLAIEVAQAQAQHQAWLHQQRMARLTRGLVDDYAALKRERGWVDMADLERAALTLMSDPQLSGWVQERLDARVRHLLIDEFQDTNPLQWQALRAWLDGYGGAGRAPSVFIVGDPKQSIYRFRRAEPQVFRAAKVFVAEGLDGELLSCDHTRRNAPEVVGVVNQVMLQAQSVGEFDGYRAHTTESTALGHCWRLPRLLRDPPDAATAQEPVWRDSLTVPRREPEETRKVLECRQAAKWLYQQLNAPGATLQPADIMVLARKRERLGLMQAELQALHISAQQPEKTDLIDCPEVQDLVALLDALVSPGHNLSLARALKSPLFGIQDADLVTWVVAQRASLAPTVSWLESLKTLQGLPAPLTQAGQCLTQWQQWVQQKSPHDALCAIYEQGDVIARFAAAAPASRRAAVIANLQALVSASLQVDGGRYLTSYALVRALRSGGNPAPVRADAQAVRLLTVHGAKGLEAPLVLLLDTDGEAPKPETMGVLVQWPGEAPHPQRFAFVASESRPSACLLEALEAEQVARQREELNGLYVAMTRAQHMLVVSSLEPHSGSARSWWHRLEALVPEIPNSSADLSLPDAAVLPSSPAVGGTFKLLSLPKAGLAQAGQAVAAIKLVAEENSEASRLGQAMHRLLEWVAPQPGGVQQADWSAGQRAAVARQFELDTLQVDAAATAAQGILRGAGAWAWDRDLLQWHGNEVALLSNGQTVRIDRLVRRQDAAQWWVLDYKTHPHPDTVPPLCAQLKSYQRAVARAYPNETVRAAFLTPQGALIELK